MADPKCGVCPFRAKYDTNPKSILGRLWRWHTNFCPGWRAYMKSLTEPERRALIDRYGFRSDKFA